MTLTAEVKTADLALPEGATFRLSMTPAGRLKVDSTGGGGGGGGNVNIVGINGGTALAAGAGASDATSPRVTIANGSTVAIGGSATLNAGSVTAISSIFTLTATGTFQVAGTVASTTKSGFFQNRNTTNAEVLLSSSTVVSTGLPSVILPPYDALNLNLGSDNTIYQGVISVAGTTGMTFTLVQGT